jgi:hypothetical protein
MNHGANYFFLACQDGGGWVVGYAKSGFLGCQQRGLGKFFNLGDFLSPVKAWF